ncbi:hypothetical protein [Sediminibacillus halophilus]|uniref:Uncharacterized protein n=1 Tax=Sediminibacillus halophilus TaxID=482461 RepID=A0A1G9PCH1_9BACI|nr:hypothetical protein [Sediminibacillus halophilus]SDL96414.1 hypothetical protein SAMN05216244_1374 [Sediminibacillus halophilus]
MSNRTGFLVMLSFFIFFLAACSDASDDSAAEQQSASGEESPAEDGEAVSDTPEKQEETNEEEARTSVEEKESPEEQKSKDTVKNQSDTSIDADEAAATTNERSNPAITDGEAAITYLKQQLEMKENEDIVFDDLGGKLKEDEAGSYYTITLTSKAIEQDGGSGTVGVYKVYQNGEYEMKG